MNSFVEVNPKVMMGKPVLRGTRITVENILERLGAGETVKDILEAYPQLSSESIQGTLAFAAEVLSGEVVYPFLKKPLEIPLRLGCRSPIGSAAP